ncbi:MAG: hypothetical protein KBT36_16325 [Kurthia sp.]|nr:hypothetical protein [Candidatus Kurthia equi]
MTCFICLFVNLILLIYVHIQLVKTVLLLFKQTTTIINEVRYILKEFVYDDIEIEVVPRIGINFI